MNKTLSYRLGRAAAAALAAIGLSLLVPAMARSALPIPMPANINLGGLHLAPSSGDGTEMPAFTADSACPGGTNIANVNTIDTLGVEQTLSLNVPGPVAATGGFGSTFMTDMASVQALGGTPGTAESFLFLVDCRVGADHGTYTDAVQVDYAADGRWVVHGGTPASPSPSPSRSASPSPSPSLSRSPSASPSTPVATASSSSPPPAGGNLPVTGVDVLAIAGAAVAMVAAGAGLRYAARRKKT